MDHIFTVQEILEFGSLICHVINNYGDLVLIVHLLIYLFNYIDNRFDQNVLGVIEKILRYQQQICLAGEGIKSFKIEVSNDHVLFKKFIGSVIINI